ncbi:pyruvate kinase alpha/beta domain-containing protein [Thermovenabulum gondwanense]|uniref:Pyruvate kinase C-terminal domain-containing protein n=1 Tax=Thermovenabulum gondwanense TaxID=520767 RepID=A0A162MKT5_9FIRM|nr:pyruvate kinase alpha/beta domain-containing protein [Thermovenabulum gondwanense]KYO66509.1 hypothetical protein ATZ99_11370 [Thermovenabulum gondwanense]
MYFEKPGAENTQKTVEIVKRAVEERGIRHVVAASNEGRTAKLLVDANINANLVIVTHACGFRAPGDMEFPGDLREELIKKGVKVLTTTHVLSGAERGLSRKFGGVYPVEIIANTLRMFGQGVKVCLEVATMALDAGLIPYGEEIIAIGGTSEGADSAVIMKPAHAANIMDTWISEILCKPKNRN